MNYDKYQEVKGRGVTSAFLLRDKGIKIFPVCLNLRKFQHLGTNHFVQLNISFEVLFDIENYYTIGFDLYHFNHHQSNVSHKPPEPTFTIKQEPLYEYGNEERFLPLPEMIHVFHTEQQVLDYIHEGILVYEQEQNLQIWSGYIKYWEIHKKNVFKKTKLLDNNSLSSTDWKTLFELFNKYENHYKLKGNQ